MAQDPPSSIMVVDDQPANLKLMEDMLRQEGYVVRSFPRGRMALAAAAQQPPDLVLLDINMPEMDGFEVCRRLKADPRLAPIPVIFLSALNETEDKVRAFDAGGVDYVTKPFQFEEIRARAQTHIQLEHARRIERDLLEKTLKGAIKTLANLVHMTGPALSARSESIRGTVVHLASKLEVEDPWQYEMAAMLCLIGCIVLPADVFERAYSGELVTAEEERMFHAHPDVGYRLLANIPRLENVAAMIRQQQSVGEDTVATGVVPLGAGMLRVALELDRRIVRGSPFKNVLRDLRAAPGDLPVEMLKALEDYSPPQSSFDIRRLKIADLCVSMILEEDVFTQDGAFMILSKGTVLNFTLVERLRNFARTRTVRQPVQVRVVRLSASI